MDRTYATPYHQSNRCGYTKRSGKEEKRLRYDNSPYGQLIPQVKKNIFKNHPYRWTTIGSMDHLTQQL
jgi:predicted Zn-dependent peptidase